MKTPEEFAQEWFEDAGEETLRLEIIERDREHDAEKRVLREQLEAVTREREAALASFDSGCAEQVRLANALAAAEARVAEARGLLRDLEWSGTDRLCVPGGEPCCPDCGAIKGSDRRHSPGCKLDALLNPVKAAPVVTAPLGDTLGALPCETCGGDHYTKRHDDMGAPIATVAAPVTAPVVGALHPDEASTTGEAAPGERCSTMVVGEATGVRWQCSFRSGHKGRCDVDGLSTVHPTAPSTTGLESGEAGVSGESALTKARGRFLRIESLSKATGSRRTKQSLLSLLKEIGVEAGRGSRSLFAEHSRIISGQPAPTPETCGTCEGEPPKRCLMCGRTHLCDDCGGTGTTKEGR
jgi:hypothetical protein